MPSYSVKVTTSRIERSPFANSSPILSNSVMATGEREIAFCILIFPRFSIFAVFALMAVVLILRPWGLLGRPLKA